MRTTLKEPKLLDQVKFKMTTKHFSKSTQNAYLFWIKKYIYHFNKRHPKELSKEYIIQFIEYLARSEHVAKSTQNQALSALLFLYRAVLNQKITSLKNLKFLGKDPKLPVVLSKEEVHRLFIHLNGEQRFMAELIYGTGMRIIECMSLRINDIDLDYNQIIIRNSKGNKDRVTVLPQSLRSRIVSQIKLITDYFEYDKTIAKNNVYVPMSVINIKMHLMN